MTAIQPIRPAATVMIVRDAEPGVELFMLKRTSNAAFAGGMFVFPGGRVDSDDHLHKYDAVRRGPTDAQQPQQAALGNEWRGYWIAGIRESYEEAGLLLAYTGSGKLLDYDEHNRQRFADYRHHVHAGSRSLRQICEEESLTLAVDRIHFVNRFVTPLGRPRRFDTRFFLAEAPPGQAGLHDQKETVDSIWISPREALARNDAKEFDLMRVTRVQIEMLAQHNSMNALLDWVRGNREFPVRRPLVPSS